MEYWNHNSAYNKWIDKNIKDKIEILDVGCGNGSLCRFLYEKNSKRNIIGLDPSHESILLARGKSQNIAYVETIFEKYEVENKRYDVIIFVASLHHMDLKESLLKTRTLLKDDGIVLIVGLSKPSNILEYIVELLRILPCKISSSIHKMESSEELNVSTSYDFPKMNAIRKNINEIFSKSKIKYGLYYRYLAICKK